MVIGTGANLLLLSKIENQNHVIHPKCLGGAKQLGEEIGLGMKRLRFPNTTKTHNFLKSSYEVMEDRHRNFILCRILYNM